MKTLFIPLIVFAAVAIIGGIYRMPHAQNTAQAMQQAEQQYRRILEHTWPSDNEARSVHLQNILFQEPIARATPDVIARCESLTREAMPNVKMDPDHIPIFTFECLATGAAASLSGGNLTVAAELVSKAEKAREIMRREAGIEEKTVHERCMRRAFADYENGVDAILTSYSVCVRGLYFASLQLTRSKLIDLFPANERAAFDSEARDTARLFKEAILDADAKRTGRAANHGEASESQ